jgi:hypothetical protein
LASFGRPVHSPRAEVSRLDGDTYRLVGAHAGDERPRLEPFDAIELELAALGGHPAK